MFQRKPLSGKWNGLTIVMSNPSRFDMSAKSLLSGNAGIWFQQKAMNGVLLPYSHVCCAEDLESIPEGTKVALLLGDGALQKFGKQPQLIDDTTSLNQQRGSPFRSDSGTIYIASYLPQDTHDVKSSYEQNLNPYLRATSINNSEQSDSDETEKEGDDSDTKTTKGKTRRGNYRFWLEKDCQKAIGLLSGRRGIDSIDVSKFRIYADSDEIIYQLLNNKGCFVEFDIETNSLLRMTCFSFSFNFGPTYCVPLIRFDYSPAYTDIPRILWALAIAIQNNIVVGHNISSFDLFVLAYKYGIGCGKNNYDTMLAHKRIWPDVEKSLGHCISLYTTLPYHKSEGVFEPHNSSEEQQLWEYNAKDVETLKMVKAGIDKEAERIKATESIRQVNASIRVYLTMSLQGIKFSPTKREEMIVENDRRMNAILKIIKWLVGYDMLPSSNKQCTEYFHEACGMTVISRSVKTHKPSLQEESLLKLYVKESHPLIPLCIYFRQLQKETSTLSFTPWIDNNPITNELQT